MSKEKEEMKKKYKGARFISNYGLLMNNAKMIKNKIYPEITEESAISSPGFEPVYEEDKIKGGK